jgi:hypothetical protein
VAKDTVNRHLLPSNNIDKYQVSKKITIKNIPQMTVNLPKMPMSNPNNLVTNTIITISTMKNLKLILGIIWASPITLVTAIFFFIPCIVFRQIKYVEWDEAAWSFISIPGSVLHNYLTNSGYRGFAAGNIIVYRAKNYPKHKEATVRIHELEHVKQCMRLSVFQPIIYFGAWVGIYFGSIETHPYYDNPFEIAARRVAGQRIDLNLKRKHRWKLGVKENNN